MVAIDRFRVALLTVGAIGAAVGYVTFTAAIARPCAIALMTQIENTNENKLCHLTSHCPWPEQTSRLSPC